MASLRPARSPVRPTYVDLSFSTLLSKMSPLLLPSSCDGTKSSTARPARPCAAVTRVVPARSAPPRHPPLGSDALGPWTSPTAGIPHGQDHGRGWQGEKCLSLSREMACQQNADKLQQPFPNMDTGPEQLGADGSFCQFLILPV